MKLNELLTQDTRESEGEWMPYAAGVELLIAPMGNQRYDDEVQKRMRPLRKKRRGGKLKPDEMREINMKAVARYVLLDWRGVTDDGGETPEAYSAERGFAAFKTNYRFFKDVLSMAGGAEDELIDFDEDSEGNLPGTSGGGSNGDTDKGT